MGLKHEIETAKKSGAEGSLLQKLSKKARKSFKQKKEDKKKRRVKEFLVDSFRKITARAGALMDFYLNARITLAKISEKGGGIGKSARDHEGYYSQEENDSFALAAKLTKVEEGELEKAAEKMRRLANRDHSLMSSAQYLRSYCETEVKDSYQRFDKGIAPLFLRPKSNISKSATDKSAHSFGKRVAAAAILSFELTSMYKGAQLDAAGKILDSRMSSIVMYGQQEPTISSLPPGMKVVFESPYEAQKKEIELRKKSLDAAGKLMDFFKDKLEDKKAKPRLYKQVDVMMARTKQGDAIRQHFSLKIATKLFDFGGWHVQYT